MTLIWVYRPLTFSGYSLSHKPSPSPQSNQHFKATMVSSRALEYVSRFSKGCSAEEALKQIVAYRDECKNMYNDAVASAKGFKNYPEQKAYLEDMMERIGALAEARDYAQSKLAPAKSAMPFAPTKPAAPTKLSKPTKKTDGPRTIKKYAPLTRAVAKKMGHLTRTEQSLKGRGFNEHEVKYILRFQQEGIMFGAEYGSPDTCVNSASEYEDVMRDQRNQYDEGSSDYEFYNDRVQALKVVCQYFYDMAREVPDLYMPVGYDREDN